MKLCSSPSSGAVVWGRHARLPRRCPAAGLIQNTCIFSDRPACCPKHVCLSSYTLASYTAIQFIIIPNCMVMVVQPNPRRTWFSVYFKVLWCLTQPAVSHADIGRIGIFAIIRWFGNGLANKNHSYNESVNTNNYSNNHATLPNSSRTSLLVSPINQWVGLEDRGLLGNRTCASEKRRSILHFRLLLYYYQWGTE
jgi:hypothetical protein